MPTRTGTWLISIALVLGWTGFAGQAQAPTGKSAAPKLEPLKPGQKAPATLEFKVPANATVWFAGQKMSQTGVNRSYQSPPIEVGKTYYYTIKIAWPLNGPGEHSTTQEVAVRAGEKSIIDFTPLAPAATPSAPATTTGTRTTPAAPTGSRLRPLFSRPTGGSGTPK